MKGIGDLSRRVSPYFLPGLSFREYLEFNKILEHKVIKPDDILSRHSELAKDINIKTLILPEFQNYLKYGFYAFYADDKEKYYERLKNIITVILDSDIPAVVDIPYLSVNKMKKLLTVITTSASNTPNLTSLEKKIGITDQRTLLKYMTYLEKAMLIRSLRRDAAGDKILRKPEKGDFQLNNKYTIEVGGKSKSDEQIKGVENAFLAADNIEIGFFNKIPLWLFGFLY